MYPGGPLRFLLDLIKSTNWLPWSTVEHPLVINSCEDNGGPLEFLESEEEGERLVDNFTDLQLRTLSSDYAFYCCTDGSGKKETGRYIAVSQYQEPVENDDHTYNFEAFIGILNQPNSPVRESTVTNTFIDQQSAVGGKNPAAIVAKTHSNLIRALLA